jgi:hypothetical protein
MNIRKLAASSVLVLAAGSVVGGTTALASAPTEGCTSVVGLPCHYRATQVGGVVAVGFIRVTIVRHGRTMVVDHMDADDLDYAGLAHVWHDVIKPGDDVTVETFFCICCPVPQFAMAGAAAQRVHPS